jgi:hypothetical protein
VYALFCTHQLGLHMYTEKMWNRLEDAVQPANGDLFAVDVAANPKPEEETAASPIDNRASSSKNDSNKKQINPMLQRQSRRASAARSW